MWIERYTIVVPTLAALTGRGVEAEVGMYSPSWVEWSITAASFSGFALLYVVFAKLFPIISIWEIEEGREHAVNEASERVRRSLCCMMHIFHHHQDPLLRSSECAV